ncbi:MAG: CAP domain-containing protein [Hyphomicrobium sp.]|uniref:CAP domain-containing protein n=1 Tax=Hyphomicrobium sp. TaxID=82 RepID=UPI003D0CC154
MYRVALSAVLAASLGLGACSLNTGGPLATGYNDIDNTGSITPAGASVFSTSTGSVDRTSVDRTSRSGLSGTQVAALTPDKAPKGSFEKAPAGALSDRDYSHTALDAERARDLINQYRRDNGLKPLVLNASLTEAAKEHSRDLAKWDRISHYGSDGSNPWDRVKRAGYKPRLAAENVGTGQVTFTEVLRGWKDSAGHNKNLLLSDAREMGLALVQDPKTEFKSFWTLVIGTSM